VFSSKIADHGGRHGDAMRALARWQHPVALSEAHDVFHSGDVPYIAPPHPHGNQNCKQFALFFCCHQFIVYT